MAGRPLGIVPQGVAARESLRTEAGYLLNGNDMDARDQSDRSGPRLGGQALEGLHRQGCAGANRGERASRGKWSASRSRVRATIRNGYRIYRNGKEIGRVTSGPLSATLDRPQLRAGIRGDRRCGDRHRARSRHPWQALEGTGRRVAVLRAPGQGRARASARGRRMSCASASSTCVGGSRRRKQGRRRDRHLGFRPAQPRRHPVAWSYPRSAIRSRAAPRWGGSTATAEPSTSSRRCRAR